MSSFLSIWPAGEHSCSTGTRKTQVTLGERKSIHDSRSFVFAMPDWRYMEFTSHLMSPVDTESNARDSDHVYQFVQMQTVCFSYSHLEVCFSSELKRFRKVFLSLASSDGLPPGTVHVQCSVPETWPVPFFHHRRRTNGVTSLSLTTLRRCLCQLKAAQTANISTGDIVSGLYISYNVYWRQRLA